MMNQVGNSKIPPRGQLFFSNIRNENKTREIQKWPRARDRTSLRLYNAQKYYVSPTQDGSEVSHSDSWRIGNTPTFYPSLYRFQFPYRNKEG
jgi:hypothetical protein